MKRLGRGDLLQQGAEVEVMPTLGQVAVEEDFAPLRELLKTVANRPVDQLGADLRGWVKEEALRLDCYPVALAFFGACEAAVRSAEERKRARIDEGDKAAEGEVVHVHVFVWCSSLA